MNILVTGGAGFIGNHVALRLIKDGHDVVIVDNINNYYDPNLKEARIKRLPADVPVYRVDISDREAIEKIFKENKFDAVCHLAAQAGVRYSLENPFVYAQSNVVGTLNILEFAKRYDVDKVVCASTSSVYGNPVELPSMETARADEPISIYAASKRSTELLGYAYHHLFNLNIIFLRFFTVYGPWGRPDMAFFTFTKAILAGEPIELYNSGEMKRDFTYIDDIVDGFILALKHPAGFNIFNLGHGKPVHLRDFISIIEDHTGKKAVTIEKPMQPGDVSETYADVSKAQEMLGFQAKVSIEEGMEQFIKWYREYYNIESIDF